MYLSPPGANKLKFIPRNGMVAPRPEEGNQWSFREKM